jgi:hypothetical protein
MKIFFYDLAREQSWVGHYWRRILPDVRDLGYDEVALYVEQRFHFRSLPAHRPWGGITPAQADEARRLCRRFGLRLQWATNTLGHFDGLLANDYFRYLGEDIEEGSQICPSHPDTRPLIRHMLRELVAFNPSPVLHIGGDEAWALNRCPRCQKRRLSNGELYLDHMRWVIRETKRLGKRPGIYGDMMLAHPEIIPHLDRDTLIYDWHYESGSADTIRLFQKHGFEVVPMTATNEWSTLFHPFRSRTMAIEPFMSEARELGCRSMCVSLWELTRGSLGDNQWERIAAAPAAFEGRPLTGFARRFFGSARADQGRLQPILDERKLKRIHPLLAGWDHGRQIRLQFMGTDSIIQFYATFGQPDTRRTLAKVMQLVRRTRPIVRDIQRAAKRRLDRLEHLDLPLELFETAYDRLETMSTVRATVDRTFPHRLSNVKGTKLLWQTVRQLSRHIARCESLASRFEQIQRTRGGTHLDGLRLRKQIGQLKTLRRYVTYHAKTYAKGVPVPTHELWGV